ncbi:hypothetical protein SPRG_12657 [Saprolegnia parasitica CBS 223.65]|uniref:AMP-binding enzyme C-terminal domain-containing protein n=1 Tax=Saprolegnia parasitica (strain CBS 223.65) TaxID=695850 RepID=A0A067BUH0_SAPPC|nr:hypothetical protein SPRG_12657 [Saprolegnia parasitica CBS 223.65]KDO22159.1 hypothetical protein SPRG_12657 [Saprolegnia parasitica CBS 223.65]|eukprot:XP_012207099.1 hypothetical protein SPRG_12657 [Saprolegnia parasitica CBS 223.65]
MGLLVGALSALVQGSRLCLLEPTGVSGPVLAKLLLLHEPKRLVLSSVHVMHLTKVGEAIACVDVVDCVGTSVPTLPRALRSLYTVSSKFQPFLRFRRIFCGPTTIYTASDPMPLPIAAPLVHSVGLPVSSSIVLRIQSMTTNEVLGPKQVGEMCVGADACQRLGVLAYVDAAQQLHLIGSKDGILKLGAEATTALEIEEVVASHPLVEDAVVTCSEGQRLAAYVKLAAATLTYSADALRSIHAYACKQIPTSKQFHRLVAVDSIPRDVMGHAYRALVLDDANALQYLDATQL